MPLFIKDRAYKYFNHHSLNMINKIVNHRVNIYKMVLKETLINIYGESSESGKVYYPPVMVHCLIAHEDQTYDVNNQKIGVDLNQNTTFYFQREYLKAISLVLEIGDIIEWNNALWHIDSVVENRLVHSVSDYNHAIVCMTHMTERSRLNIEEVRFGSDDTTDIQKLKNL